MGSGSSKIPDHEMARFEKRTFFTRSEILNLYARFEMVGGDIDTPVSSDKLLESLPELLINPFRHRIVHVFGTQDEEDNKFYLGFEDFLQMFNAFSPRSSLEVKAYWAFKLYDFNGDNFLDRSDIVNLLRTTIGDKKMTLETMRRVAQKVLDEADLDGNNKLSRTEFMRTIYRLPDFAV